jgi:hypoxanthine phosphoribosyltransferase
MVIKEFIDPRQLVRDSFALARMIYDSGFRPDVLLVLWRGGTPVGIVVHEFFQYKGVQTYHAAVKAESYIGIDKRIEPRIEQLEGVIDRLNRESKVLVIDDIFDSGCTLKKVCELLASRTRLVKTATLYYKIRPRDNGFVPDYHLRKTANWVVFPHEIVDLTLDEIRAKDVCIHELLTC